MRPKQKHSPNNGLQRGDRLQKKQKLFSPGKVRATVFWDSHGVILTDYLQKEKTITGAYYASLLDKLKAKLEEKRVYLRKKKILLHQDSASSYTLVVALAKIHELRFELLDHPLYSPNIAPSDFYLFLHLKIALGGQIFSSNEEMNNDFAEKNAEYYLDGLQRWEHCWEKSVELKGVMLKNSKKKMYFY
ncbi:histone-lysine N-methyltransferase SETMAR [Trichonephila clavipes]|nr:histone-lysine N-methyltransferase SETMAR [Trichonephila clavipes]